jgi:hypothetical protein
LKKKVWTSQLARLLRKSRIHIEFHSKLFTRTTKNGLKNEMVKLSVMIFLWNLNQIVVMNFWRVRSEPYFQKFFEIIFLCLSKKLCPMGTWLKYLIGLLFLWTLWGFLLRFPKWVHYTSKQQHFFKWAFTWF